MTFRLRWGRMLCVSGVVVLALVAGLAVFVQIQQRILRWRAERLLADMRELQSHKSTWADAQKIMTRWGEWGSYDGSCTAERCDYSVHVQDSILAFIENHREQFPSPGLVDVLFKYPFVLVGERGDWVDATLRIKDGIIAESRYDIFLIVPFGNSPETRGGYALVGIASQSANGFGPNFRTDRLLHPEYWIGVTGGCEGCIKFMTESTPFAGREKVRELTDFNFSCITRWWPCSKEADIMPSAWRQYQEELPGRQARMDAFDQCTVPLEFFGREEENIVIAEIISRQANRAPDSAELAIRLNVSRVLKGQIDWPLNKPVDAMIYDQYFVSQKWSSTDLVAGQKFILLAGIGKNREGKNGVSLDECGAVPYNEQNLSAIQRGIDASLARRIPER